MAHGYPPELSSKLVAKEPPAQTEGTAPEREIDRQRKAKTLYRQRATSSSLPSGPVSGSLPPSSGVSQSSQLPPAEQFFPVTPSYGNVQCTIASSAAGFERTYLPMSYVNQPNGYLPVSSSGFHPASLTTLHPQSVAFCPVTNQYPLPQFIGQHLHPSSTHSDAASVEQVVSRHEGDNSYDQNQPSYVRSHDSSADSSTYPSVSYMYNDTQTTGDEQRFIPFQDELGRKRDRSRAG